MDLTQEITTQCITTSNEQRAIAASIAACGEETKRLLLSFFSSDPVAAAATAETYGNMLVGIIAGADAGSAGGLV